MTGLARHQGLGPIGDSVRAGFATIAKRLSLRLPELADQILEELVNAEPSYRTAVPRQELRDAIEESFGLILERLEGVRNPRFNRSAEALGERRARQGVPFDAAVRRLHRDFELLWGAMRAEARSLGIDDATMLEGVEILWEIIDSLTVQYARGYRRGDIELNRRNEQRRNHLFDLLLEGRGDEPALATEAAATLELPQRGPFVVVAAVDEPGDDARGSPALRVPAALLRRHRLRWAWRDRTDHSVGLVALGPGGVEPLVEALASQWRGRAGVSPAFMELADMTTACEYSQLALLSLPVGRNEVALLDDRLPQALIASNAGLAQRLRDNALGPILALPERERGRLLETVEVFLDTGGSVSATSERMFCHRNTVLQRLGRVRELTGLTARQPRDAALLYLALQARRA